MKSFLVAYEGQVKKDYKKESIVLSKLPDEKDFLSLSHDYLRSISSLVTKKFEQKAFQGRTHEKHGRLSWGLIDCGNFGYAATMKNVETRQTTYQRDVNDVELLSYFYMFYVPTGYDRCIIILQKHGNSGIKSILTDALINQFNSDYSDYDLKLSFNPYLDTQTLYKYLKGGLVQKFRFISKSLPRDVADQLEKKGVESQGEAELVFKRLDGKTMRAIFGDKLESLEAGKKPKGSITSIDMGFDYDYAILDVKDETGRQKSFRLDASGFIESREIDTNDEGVHIYNGLPTYESVYRKSIDYLLDMCDNLNVVKPHPIFDKPDKM